jgi:hypothetical protein
MKLNLLHSPTQFLGVQILRLWLWYSRCWRKAAASIKFRYGLVVVGGDDGARRPLVQRLRQFRDVVVVAVGHVRVVARNVRGFFVIAFALSASECPNKTQFFEFSNAICIECGRSNSRSLGSLLKTVCSEKELGSGIPVACRF